MSVRYILRNGSAGSQSGQMFTLNKSAKHFSKVVIQRCMRVPVAPYLCQPWRFLFRFNPFGGCGMVSLCGSALTLTRFQSIPLNGSHRHLLFLFFILGRI